MNTKDRILDAALDLFAEDGVAGTTITEIERRAGLAAGSGSLYRHYRSKDEVLEAAVVREVEELRRQGSEERARLPRPPDRRSRLTLQYHLLLGDVQRFDRLLRILRQQKGRVSEVHAIVARSLGVDRGLEDWLAGTDDESADDGGDQADIDPLTTVVVLAALVGFVHLGQLQDKPFVGVEPGAFVDRLVELTAPPVASD